MCIRPGIRTTVTFAADDEGNGPTTAARTRRVSVRHSAWLAWDCDISTEMGQ
jgi:hypothetical protein